MYLLDATATSAAAKTSRWSRLALGVLLVAPLAIRPALIGGDEPHYALMAWSIAFDGDFRLDNNYEDVETKSSVAAGERFAGRHLDRHEIPAPGGPRFSHPIGLPLLAVPMLWIGRIAALPNFPDLPLLLLTLAFSVLGLVSLRRLVSQLLGNPAAGSLVACAVYFCSPLWFYSRSFFTEPYLAALVPACALAAFRERYILCGAGLGLMMVIKEPGVLFVGAFLVGILWLRGVSPALHASVGPVLGACAFLVRNLFVYRGGAFEWFQPFGFGSPGRGLIGSLFDTTHGLLPFFPLAALAVVGWWFRCPNVESRRIAFIALFAFLGWLVLAACWVDWRGGSCFGPRLLVPSIPLLGVPLSLGFRQWLSRRWFREAFLAVASAGAALEAAAIVDPFRASWGVDAAALLSANRVSLAAALASVLVVQLWMRRLAAVAAEANSRRAA